MNMIEKVADLEHQQWATWTKHMLDNLTPENIERWRKQINTPYAELSEADKEKDRIWARKVIEAMLEPTEDMIEAVREFNGLLPLRECIIADYQDMIKAALKEE